MPDDILYEVEDGKLKVTKSEVVTSQVYYKYDYLMKQRESIVAQKERDSLQRDKELAEVDALILEAKKASLDVVPEPIIIEDQPEEEVIIDPEPIDETPAEVRDPWPV